MRLKEKERIWLGIILIGLFLKKGSEGNQYNDLFSSEKRPNIDFHRSFNEEKVNKVSEFRVIANRLAAVKMKVKILG